MPHRGALPSGQLERLRREYEAGNYQDMVIEVRLGKHRGWLGKQARRYGWKAPDRKKRTAWKYGTPAEIKNGERDPGDLCGGRRLAGQEFAARKAELEALDKEERERRKIRS